MRPGYVLGNGKSRLMINLDRLKSNGIVYGCNALYRDFSPHYLVATDSGISAEIEQSGYPLTHKFYTRKPTIGSGSRKIEYHYGFSSGPIALKMAAMNGHEHVYMCGFDLAGIRGKQNNVYSDTDNYRQSTDPETYYGNWIDQISIIMNEHPECCFIKVGTANDIVPVIWMKHDNFKIVMIDDFVEDINTTSWLK